MAPCCWISYLGKTTWINWACFPGPFVWGRRWTTKLSKTLCQSAFVSFVPGSLQTPCLGDGPRGMEADPRGDIQAPIPCMKLLTLMRCTVKVSAGSFSEVLGACTTNGCTTPTPTIQLLITLCWDSLTFVKSWWMFLRRSYHTSTWGKCTQMSMRLFTLCSLVVLNLGPLDRTYIYCMVLCLGQPWSHRLWGLTLSCAAGLGRSTMQSRAEGKSPAALVVCWDNRESLCSRSIPSALQWIYFIPWPSVPRLRNGPDFVQ